MPDYGSYRYDVVRDTSSRIVAKAEEESGTVSAWGYSYDALGRLATVTLDGELAESYAYDVNGNRTQTRVPARGIGTTLTSVFDAEDRASTVGTPPSPTLTFTITSGASATPTPYAGYAGAGRKPKGDRV